MSNLIESKKGTLTTFRFTVPSHYEKGTKGWNNPQFRKGYLAEAMTLEDAQKQIAAYLGLHTSQIAPDLAYLEGRENKGYPFVN